jgi:hypothetical protein
MGDVCCIINHILNPQSYNQDCSLKSVRLAKLDKMKIACIMARLSLWTFQQMFFITVQYMMRSVKVTCVEVSLFVTVLILFGFQF